MKITEKIYVAGHQGLVGSAIVRQLKKNGYTNIITKTKDELDLTDQKSVLIKNVQITYFSLRRKLAEYTPT